MKFIRTIKADTMSDFFTYIEKVKNQIESVRDRKKLNEASDILSPLNEELKKAYQSLSSFLADDNLVQKQKTFNQLEKEGVDVELIKQICTYVWGYGAYDNKFAKQYTPEKWLKDLERMLENATNTKNRTVGEDIVVTKYPKAIKDLKQWMANL